MRSVRSAPATLCALALLGSGACRAPAETSFLLVSMDTFRGDRLGAIDTQGRSLTPSLDALAAQGQVYTRAFAQANETLYSHASLFTARYPTELGPLRYESFKLPPDAPTLAAYLAQGGYRTEAVVAGGHLSAHFGLGSGFQRYQAMTDFSSFQETVPAALTRLEDLAAAEEPFLLFVHGYDAHSPYLKAGPLFRLGAPGYSGPMVELARNPLTYERILHDRYYPTFSPSQLQDDGGHFFVSPGSFDELEDYALAHPEAGVPLSSEDLAFLLGSYDAAVRHADTFVGILLDGLQALGLEDEVVVIVMADHGEDLLEHGHFNHRLSLHDENVHVPLLMRVPGREASVWEQPVALADLLPTVLELASLRERPGRGQSLLEPTAGRAVYSESMRGDVSVRSAEARLFLPRDAVQEVALPEAPPPGAWLGDDGGAALPWDDPRAELLWRALLEVMG